MPRDFNAKHIRVSQLIASGGITGQPKLGLAIYSASAASSLVGGMNSHLTTRIGKVGPDTFFYVDGTPNYRQTGSLDAMFGSVASYYEEEFDTAVANLSSLKIML